MWSRQRGFQLPAIVLAGCLGLCLIIAGCGQTRTKPEETSPGGVISFGPNVTETIFALGQGSRISAVTSFCDYPPEAANLPKVGGPMNPALEVVASLQPSIIIHQGNPQKLLDFAQVQGIPAVGVNMDSIATVKEGIRVIGKALECPNAADALRFNIQTELDAVFASVKDRPRPKVLIITGRDSHSLNSLFTVGRDSFVSELVGVAGGDNIFLDSDQAYFEASKETVVVREPEVILEFHAGQKLTEAEREQYKADWKELPSLPAVENGRIYLITESYTLRPGPRIGKTARLLARCLHPEAGVGAP